MSNVQQLLKRNAYAFTAGLFLLAATIPTLVAPQFASAAAQVTQRSIKMSSSTISAASQTYEVNFTTATTGVIQGVVVDFCAESPILGSSTCTKPSNMTVGTANVTQSGLTGTSTSWTGSTIQSGKTLEMKNASGASINTGTAVTISIDGFTNPDAVGTFYARILTFATTTAADNYTSGTPGAYVDGGGVALSATRAIGITATVQETLTFCVLSAVPTANCANAAANPPSIVLGNGSTPSILDTAGVYTSNVYFLLSTNSSNATTVRMKGASANLVSGSNTIPGVGASPTAITAGTAAFGMRSAAGTALSGGSGTVTPASPYNDATNYGMDSTTSGDNVTSPYGDTIATATGPLLNVYSPLTFAATAGATTPAGVYTTAYSLVASSSY